VIQEFGILGPLSSTDEESDPESLIAMKERKTIGSLIPLLRLHKWAFPAIVVLGLLQSLTEVIGIGLFIPLLNALKVGSQPRGKSQWLVDRMDGLFHGVPPDRRIAVILVSLFAAVLATALLAPGVTTFCSHGSTETLPMICDGDFPPTADGELRLH
jgi:hypothetical protein